MKEFKYTLTDEHGIHARPAGSLVKLAKTFTSVLTAETGGKTADIKKIFSLMGLGAKKGDEVTIRAEGDDETEAAAHLQDFLAQNM